MASNPLDLYIGKGILSFTPDGGVKRDLGEVDTFAVTPALEKIEKKGNRAGVKSTVRTVIVEKSATFNFVMSEFSVENLALGMLGELDTAGTTLDIFKLSEVKGALEYVGTNDIGPRFTVLLPNVSITPQGEVGFITDEWGTLEVSGDVNLDGTGSFGTVTQTRAGQ